MITVSDIKPLIFGDAFSNITTYDTELAQHVDDAINTMADAGVSQTKLEDNTDSQVKFAIVTYCKAWIGNDRSECTRYMKAFWQKVQRISIVPEEVDE